MTFEEEKDIRSSAMAKIIVEGIDKKNLFLLNSKYPRLQRFGIWLAIGSGIMSIPEHLYAWYHFF